MELQLGARLDMFPLFYDSLLNVYRLPNILTFLLCSPELGVYAYSAAQVKKAIEVGG